MPRRLSHKVSIDREGSVAVKLFSRSKIELHKEIGSGSFGKVLKGTLKESRVQVAVKVFYQEFVGLLPNVDSKLRETAYDELSKVAVLDHENIVKLLGMVDDDIPWLVFEYMQDGNLLEFVMRKKDHVKERTLLRYCRDICNGMEFLHRKQFLHKDLAARNILLDGKVAKIADLGLCSFLTEDQNGAYALGGKLFPYRHAASECIVECIYTAESDVWSFGVLLFEIFSIGAVPYGSSNKQPEVRRFIADGKNPTDFQAPKCSEEIAIIMSKIFVTQRESRPNFGELLACFESLLASRGVRIPRPERRREASPFRAVPIHHQRVQELGTGSTDRLSSSPPSTSSLSGGTPPKSTMGSYPDISGQGQGQNQGSNRSHFQNHAPSSQPQIIQTQQQLHTAHQGQSGNMLGVSPPNFYGERRYSETPPRNSRKQDLLVVDSGGSGRSNSPRRTASFNNIPKPEVTHQYLDQMNMNMNHPQNQLLKDYVPNRFGGGGGNNKK